MKTIYYYIYCNGILGVKTNIKNFRWIYGSLAPVSSKDEYEKCVVKFDIVLLPEKELKAISKECQQFQSYKWDEGNGRLSCRRKLFKYINIGYDIQIQANTVYAEIGENYYRFVKNRMMNLHAVYYLLSDLANILLLNNGYITLYASAVYSNYNQRCIINFAPPNTGKTLTAVKLCKMRNYSLIGEDIVISDGKNVFSCPWTCSYRSSTVQKTDSSGSLKREKRKVDFDFKESGVITDCVVLMLGDGVENHDQEGLMDKALILTEYLFNGYTSPIVSLLKYFNNDYNKQWHEFSYKIMKKIFSTCNSHFINSTNSIDFYTILNKIIKGETV